MCVTDIPHFKEVILMNLFCEYCGYKSSEIKGGGAIPKLGKVMILNVRRTEDLEREVLKSDTAGIELSDIDLNLDDGSLGGFYTTVEGLIEKIYCQLCALQPFYCGDSIKKHHNNNDGKKFSPVTGISKRYTDILTTLIKMKNGTFFPFSITISDPLSNSFIGPIPSNVFIPSQKTEVKYDNITNKTHIDRGLVISEYERTDEQNEKLGLNDINTEKYRTYPHPMFQKGLNNNTDHPLELLERMYTVELRIPDHPHDVAKAPVEDNTIMGSASISFPIPTISKANTLDVEIINS